jgi:hypothetical protein
MLNTLNGMSFGGVGGGRGGTGRGGGGARGGGGIGPTGNGGNGLVGLGGIGGATVFSLMWRSQHEKAQLLSFFSYLLIYEDNAEENLDRSRIASCF